MTKLHILRPSSHEEGDLLTPRLVELRQSGFEIEYHQFPRDPNWLYTAGSQADRSQALNRALLSPDSDIILCARGGYGASDLLPQLDWRNISLTTPKLLVGFSDISAIHSALYSHMNWFGLHAPMPATTLWDEHPDHQDIEKLIAILQAFHRQENASGQIKLETVSQVSSRKLQGKLFGGCFSVLTSLIGTPYFPTDLSNHILFFEDIGENPGRLMRALNQWQQSGALRGATAIIMGYLKNMGDRIPDCADFVYQEFAKRLSIPVFKSMDFGHISPNQPMLIGATATISDIPGDQDKNFKSLQWQCSFNGKVDSTIS